MKIFVYIFIIFCSKVSLGQDETMPEYPNGVGEMMKFISKNTVYPKMAQDSNWTGRALISIVVDSTGKIIEPSVSKSSGYIILDNEALRVVQLMPDWKPGKQNNIAVSVKVTIPVNFFKDKKTENSISENVQKHEYVLTETSLNYFNQKFINNQPKYNGSEGSFIQNITNKLSLIVKKTGERYQGYVIMKFDIDEIGIINNPELTRISGYEFIDRTFIEVMNSMPNWIPAKINGIAVLKSVEIPVYFNIVNMGSYVQSEILLTKNIDNEIIKPQFKGGNDALQKFIKANINYPTECKKQKIYGETVVVFHVDKNGHIVNPKIRESSGNTLLDKESLRLVTSMSNWIPAFKNKKSIDQMCDIRITFGRKNKIEKYRKDKYNTSLNYFKMATNSFLQNNFNEAKVNYKNAYLYNCLYSDALFNLGVVYLKLNQTDSACLSWKEYKMHFNDNKTEELIKKYCSN